MTSGAAVLHTEPLAIDIDVSIRVGRGASAFEVQSAWHLERGVLVLFGPSGAGKSLSLEAVVGGVKPRRGHVRVAGETLIDIDAGTWCPPHRRHIGYVPQVHALFPFCNVEQNIAFGLPRNERRHLSEHVEQLIDELSLGGLRRAMPDTLSGGERQRVALARALAMRPRLLLLDEPFASLDQESREQLWQLLADTLRRHDMPAVLMTHDAAEARCLGDVIVRFERGRSVEQGTPLAILGAG
jgi:molybdate transport system ATP-binding protein